MCVCVCCRHRPHVQHTEAQPHAWTGPAVPVSSPVYKNNKNTLSCPTLKESSATYQRSLMSSSVSQYFLPQISRDGAHLHPPSGDAHLEKGERRRCACTRMVGVAFRSRSWLSKFTVLDLLATWLFTETPTTVSPGVNTRTPALAASGVLLYGSRPLRLRLNQTCLWK